MKCRYCGANIPDGELYCKKCGEEVCIVPDYNPLDDMLTAQIKLGVNDEGDLDSDYLEITRNRGQGSGQRKTTGNARDTSRNRDTNSGRNTSKNITKYTTSKNAAARTSTERERRRQAEKKKAILKRKRRRLLLTIAGVIILIAVVCIVMYQNSYKGIINKGYKAAESKEYEKAVSYFEKAISKDQKKADGYTGLSKVYVLQDKIQEAEQLFSDTIDQQPKNADIYKAYIEFYLDTKQEMKIPELLEDADDSVSESLSEYVIDEPEFSLDEDKVYDDVQQLSLTSEEAEIYYTIDGTDPSLSSTKYAEPIQLNEGDTIIKAIAVSKKGVPSLTSEKTYSIKFPIEDAPAVSPSTGQYDKAMQIEVKVPEGYEAYYTTNGSDPTTASTKYTGPIDMPEGETLFKAILVNAKGRTSGITTRNYMLDIEE